MVTHRRKANKLHRCGSCDAAIRPGEAYLIHTAFPSDLLWSGAKPQQIKECATCATRYGRGGLL